MQYIASICSVKCTSGIEQLIKICRQRIQLKVRIHSLKLFFHSFVMSWWLKVAGARDYPARIAAATSVLELLPKRKFKLEFGV